MHNNLSRVATSQIGVYSHTNRLTGIRNESTLLGPVRSCVDCRLVCVVMSATEWLRMAMATPKGPKRQRRLQILIEPVFLFACACPTKSESYRWAAAGSPALGEAQPFAAITMASRSLNCASSLSRIPTVGAALTLWIRG
jgi:hypothetical protein